MNHDHRPVSLGLKRSLPHFHLQRRAGSPLTVPAIVQVSDRNAFFRLRASWTQEACWGSSTLQGLVPSRKIEWSRKGWCQCKKSSSCLETSAYLSLVHLSSVPDAKGYRKGRLSWDFCATLNKIGILPEECQGAGVRSTIAVPAPAGLLAKRHF